MKNRIYTTISIVFLIGIMCFVIYLVGNFIYFGIYEINVISDNTNIDNTCINTNVNHYNDSSHPVKGMKVNNITFTKQQIDSITNTVKLNSSFVDREIDEGLTSGRVYK